MYTIETEISQDGEFTYSYLLTKDMGRIKIGNYEAKIISQLQNKLSRRNMQIKDLKKQLENRIVPLSKGHCVYESVMRYKKYEADKKCPYEMILK